MIGATSSISHQSIVEAIILILWFGAFGAGSLGLATNYRDWTTRYAARLVEANAKPPATWFLLTESARKRDSDPVSTRRTIRAVAVLGLLLCTSGVVFEFVALVTGHVG